MSDDFVSRALVEFAPILITLVTGVLSTLAAAALAALKTWISAKTDRAMADSLYITLENGAKALIQKGEEVSAQALVDYAKANNQKAITRLAQSDEQLADKALARLPEARKAIAEAATAEAASVGGHLQPAGYAG